MNKQIRKYGTYKEKKELKLTRMSKTDNIGKLIKDKKYKLALLSIKNYINEYGLDCFVIQKYGIYYKKLNEYEKAKYYFLKNIQNDSQNKYDSIYELGLIAKYEGDFDTSLDYFYQIINSEYRKKYDALLNIGKLYVLKEEKDMAEKIFLQIINKNMKNKAKAFEELSYLKLTNGSLEEGKYYLSMAREFGTSLKTKLIEAKIDKEEGNLKDARIKFNELIKNLKYVEFSVTELADIEYQCFNYEKSLEILEENKDKMKYITFDYISLFIMDNIELKNFNLVRNYIDELLIKYPEKQNKLYYSLGLIEFLNFNYEEALSYFKRINEEETSIYQKAIEKQVLTLIKQEKYEEAYNNYLKFINILSGEIKILLRLFLKKKLNLKISEEPNTYTEKLIINYDKQEVIEHISLHRVENSEKEIHSLFFPNINIEELYDYAVNNINENNYIKNNFIDKYLLKYPNIGYRDNQVFDFIEVITLPNSKEITTIYPANNYCPNLFKEEEKDKKEVVKTKTMSQIDKFNQKYHFS